jgi:hypothetical protein
MARGPAYGVFAEAATIRRSLQTGTPWRSSSLTAIENDVSIIDNNTNQS